MEKIRAYKRVIADKVREKWQNHEILGNPVIRMKGENPYSHWFTVLRTPMTQIDPDLYLGSAFNAANINDLQDAGIKTIINSTLELDHYFMMDGLYQYHRVPVKDINSSEIFIHFEQVINWFHSSPKPILIHCYMGSSRSAILTVLWLIVIRGFTYNDAMKRILTLRPVVNINLSYIKQLKDYITLNFKSLADCVNDNNNAN